MVGTIVGCLVGVVYLLASQALPATVAAVVAIAFGIAITGAFHLDGLADSADAFAGGTTVERRFEILKDPRLGTYGTIAPANAARAGHARSARLHCAADYGNECPSRT